MKAALVVAVFSSFGITLKSSVEGRPNTNGTYPQWVDLECEAGHKYLFSEITLNFEDAMGECGLYGGWLVSIGGQAEQNCLLRHGRSQGYDAWYWTDGNLTNYKCIENV